MKCWCSIKSRKSDSVVGPSAVFRTTSARDHRARWLAFVDGVKNQLSISSADGSAPGHRSDRARPISAVSPANPGFFPSSQEASATDRLCRIAASPAAGSAVARHYPFVRPCEHQRRANADDAGSPSRYFSRIFGRGLPLRKSPLRNFLATSLASPE